MTAPSSPPLQINPWLVAFAVSLATFMEVLDTTITNVSLSHIGGSLAASQEESTWVMTSYLVSNAIVLPLSGWLAGAIGRKRYFLLCIAFFTLASFFCGAAANLWMIIVFRLLQGIAGGGLQPTQQAIMLDTFPLEKRAQANAVMALTMIVAPVIGPTLGGFITDNFSWRWIFFINVPVGIFAFFMVNRFYHEHETPKMSSKVDYLGFALVALGIGAVQIMLDKGQQEDWFESGFIVSLFIAAVSMLSLAVWWLGRQENPLVDLKLLNIKSFRLSCILIFFMGFALYGSSILLPLLVQTYFGYDATLSGMVLSPGALAIIVMMPLITKLINRVPPKYLIAMGFFLCSTGVFYTRHFSPATDMATFIHMRILTVMGLPFLFIPISTMAFSQVPRHLNNKASALYSLFRNLGGSFGIALIATYLFRHTQIWQTNLATHAAITNPALHQTLQGYQARLMGAGVPPGAAAIEAQGLLYHQFQQQAGFMAYVDSFEAMSIILLFMVPIALLMPGSIPKKSAAAEAAH